MAAPSIILTCEHAGNQVPVRYRSLFDNDGSLNSSLGWDIGALDIAVAVSEDLDLLLFSHQTTRLLVDVNCGLGNPNLFSQFSILLGDEDKQLLLDKYYFSYRLRIENALALMQKPVIHYSIHTFNSLADEIMPSPAIAILFSAQRDVEKSIGEKLIAHLQSILPDLQIGMSVPHFEEDDTFLSYLRRRFSEEEYAGITIAINQAQVNSLAVEKITRALREALHSLGS